MRSLAANILTQINKRQGLKVRSLFWVVGKNRTTGVASPLGVWSGEDNATFNINGVDRDYVGGGGFIQFDKLKQEQGLLIRRLTAHANPISPEMDQMLRQYEPRFARCEVHLAFYDPETDELVAEPYRVFKGWLDSLNIKTPEKNGAGDATINLVGNSRILTKVLGIKKSNENQKKRLGNDRFHEYTGITGTVQTPWGEKGVSSPPPAQTAFRGVSAQVIAASGRFGRL